LGDEAGAIREIDGLPAHLYREDGEPQLKPCAEALLTEGAANAMLDRGLMPLVSLKDRDAVRLVRFPEPGRSARAARRTLAG